MENLAEIEMPRNQNGVRKKHKKVEKGNRIENNFVIFLKVNLLIFFSEI